MAGSSVTRALTELRGGGVRSAVWRGRKWLAGRVLARADPPLSSVHAEDLIAGDWSKAPSFNSEPVEPPSGGYRVAWLISPPSRTSGGHQNAFRFMSYLEQAGNPTTVYLYAPRPYPVLDIPGVKAMMAETSAYPEIAGEFRRYDPTVGLPDEYDAVIACDWQTAYAAFRHPGRAKRFYFAQDYEPFFYAAGSDYAAAENSYRLGLHGITAGDWLARTLREEHGMSAEAYQYGVESGLYHLQNRNRRNEVLFYARPPTPRRASEFGLLALQELHRRRPDIVINIVGWDMSGYDIPFPYVNHAARDIAELGAIYNRCAAGLVLSLTNTSLLPLEIMAAGVVPVVNDAPQTREVLRSEHIEFSPMSPQALAERLIAAVDREDQVEHARTIAASVAESPWGDPGAQFVELIGRAMRSAL